MEIKIALALDEKEIPKKNIYVAKRQHAIITVKKKKHIFRRSIYLRAVLAEWIKHLFVWLVIKIGISNRNWYDSSRKNSSFAGYIPTILLSNSSCFVWSCTGRG